MELVTTVSYPRPQAIDGAPNIQTPSRVEHGPGGRFAFEKGLTPRTSP